MAENKPSFEVKQYLDYAGLQRLWEKISDTYIRKANIVKDLSEAGTLIVNEDDTFIQSGEFKEAIAALEEAIGDVAITQGKLADGDTIIQDPESKLISTNIILDHNVETHEISLITKDNGNGSTVINTISYADFYEEAVKDGILQNVSLVYVPSDGNPTSDGRPEGTYLKFEWNSDSKIAPTYLCVDDLVPIYTNGDYIKIEHDYSVDGKSDDVKISLDKATLVADLNNDDVFGVSALRIYVEGVEDKVGAIEQAIQAINDNWSVLEGNVNSLLDRVGDVENSIGEIITFLEDVPYVRITEDEIDNLDDLE